ncbi:hypothetical protein [Paraflavitalea sp. CAU 1676]|uniref:hypothetical protein n=1 Tax=Paraflavitalea sp. CAU 1676 TaxID=3032598 RepID=UPI0023DB287B|nr:hypothetical protein [Paraflavitalea sp. CAU 1676]MDF2190335.1 hypothetical protein [Paraflavitalea sp. CAU 1676]
MALYKGNLKDNDQFKVLFENTVMMVGHIYESAYCINKLTGEEFGIFEFDYDPTCALVGRNNDWCLIGGEVLVLKIWADRSLRLLDACEDIFALKSIDEYTVHILTDPWDDNAAIWELTIDLKKLTHPVSLMKIRDFKEYIDKPYTDDVEW